jgi:drug/metabolite transporter (DMT)-like permease
MTDSASADTTGRVGAQPAASLPARSNLLGSLGVLFAAACWGTSAIFVKLLTTDAEISALALAFWRDLTTFIVLLTGIMLLRRKWLRVQRADLGWLVGMGVSLGTFHVLWNLGVFLNGAAVATVQQAAMPAIVAIAAWLIWRESLTWTKILAILMTFVGTVLVSGLGDASLVRLGIGGFLVGLGIPVMYASWNLFGKRIRRTYNPVTTLTYAFGVGALVLLPFQFFTPQPWPLAPTTPLWFTGLILISTILPFTVYTLALGWLPASVATILAMSEIFFVAVYAYVLLGERLTPSQILGAVLVIGGVLVLSWGRRRAPRM